MAEAVSASPERWGTLDVEALVGLLEQTTRRLCVAIEETAMDEAAYHRKFWSVWQTLPPTLSIAALNRECERQAAALAGELTLKRALTESWRARRDSLVAALEARR